MPDFNELEGYTLSEGILLEAWARYRPVQREGDSKRGKKRKKP